MPVRTYIDSGVLICAANAIEVLAERALSYLDDPKREYISSIYVQLEIIPKAVYYGNHLEKQFYETFLGGVARTVPTSSALLKQALVYGCEFGLSAVDSIHLACAVFGGAEEFITSEKPSKPLHRSKSVKVISLFPDLERNLPSV